jgi:hypothetical protein
MELESKQEEAGSESVTEDAMMEPEIKGTVSQNGRWESSWSGRLGLN